MRKHALKFISLIAFTLVAALFVPRRAAADQDDPPTRIARLSHIDGSVSFEPAGTDDWVTPVVNRPMTTGDKLWADHNSRAELHIGSASIRLGSNTGFSFLNLDDNTVQLQLTEGTLRIRVRHLYRNENFEVDTPNLAFSVLRPGIYRINVNEAGDTTVVVVRDGEGEVTGGGQSYSIHSDETGIFSGIEQLNADIEGVGSDDDLERWSYERDRREDHSISRRYVSDDAIGYEDLDEYGGWRDTTDYGTIWFPHTTVVGWAPYRYGHWVWIAPWGYTWVDDEPWGFAPFHYGRWVVVGGAWGWVPCRPAGVVGVTYVRPVYAPALVAWVGGPHIAVGVAVGGGEAVGWFPLGPREVYVPSYPVSRTYVNNVNITNTTVNTTVVNNYYNNVVVNKNVTVNNVRYVNQTVPGAVTATSPQTFTSGQSVHSNVMRVNEREMARARVVAATPPMPPTRQSVEGAGRPGAARPPAPVVNREVVAKTAPPPPPARFERQQEAIQQNGGRPLAVSQVRQIQQQQQEQPRAEVRMAPPSRQAITPQNEGNRPAPPQNVNRPLQQPSNGPQNNRPSMPPAYGERTNNTQPNQPNRPFTADRPNMTPPNAQPNNERMDRPPSARPANPNERSNTPPNVQPKRPPSNDRFSNPSSNDRPPSARPANPNDRPNTPPPNERPNTPPPNAQPNRSPSNERPNNDRPPSARPSNPPPNGNPQLEQQHQQELENMRRQQDQQRQRVEQQQVQERQRAEQQRADEQRRQQMQQQQQSQLQEMERRHAEEQQRMQQRQQQEHQQQRPQQAERQQPPPQAERQQQPPPRQQQQQPPPRQQDRTKEREKSPTR